MSETSPIVVTDDDRVRVITFNRPEARNAFDISLYTAAAAALSDAAHDDSVTVVVLTGSGQCFSAGQDLKEMAALVSGSAGPDAAKGFRGFMDALGEFDKPLLAAVNGAAVGLGFTMLAHCDMVIVSDSARMRVPFAELGVPAEAASSYLFPARMGAQRAADVLFTGRWVSADEAVDSGIALRVVASDSMMIETLELAHRIASGSPQALRAIKQLIRAAESSQITAARTREDEAFARLLGSEANLAALERFDSTGRT
jgi:enoyl-CoA hydratase/carnithine racemase